MNDDILWFGDCARGPLMRMPKQKRSRRHLPAASPVQEWSQDMVIIGNMQQKAAAT